MEWMSARHLEAISGKGPGLAGSALRQHVEAIGVRRRLRAVRTSGPRANRAIRHTRLAKLRER